MEIEVFRMGGNIKWIVGQSYSFALYTRREGKYPNEKYYTTNELKYIGKYVKTQHTGGYRDNSQYIEIFDDNGIEVIVPLDYEGRSCFKKN
jgi:hypothetical protein